MQIGNMSFTENVYQYYTKNQAGNVQEVSYEQLLQSSIGSTENANVPKFQIWSDYKEWKAQQPARKLPDSQGITEENLAYLKENFSGNLSIFQRIEAVDTMREMGMISEDQMMDTLGLGKLSLFTLDENALIISCGPTDTARKLGDWNLYMRDCPLFQADDLDDLLKQLDTHLRLHKEDDIAGNIQRILDKIAYRV